MKQLASFSSFQWNDLGPVIEIEGPAIAPGVWTGMDGKPTRYSEELLKEGAPSFLGTPIKRVHRNRDVDVVGFINKNAWVSREELPNHLQAKLPIDVTGVIWTKGIIFNPQLVEAFRTGNLEKSGLSIEAKVSEEIGPDGIWDAKSFLGTGMALVDSPAVAFAEIEKALPKKLEKGKKMSNENQGSQSQEDIKNPPTQGHSARCIVEFAMQRRRLPPRTEDEEYPYPYPAPAGGRRRRTVRRRARELAQICERVNKDEVCTFHDSEVDVELEVPDFHAEVTSTVLDSIMPELDKKFESMMGTIKESLGTVKGKIESIESEKLSQIEAQIKNVDPGFDMAAFLKEAGVEAGTFDAKVKLASSYFGRISQMPIAKTPLPSVQLKVDEEAANKKLSIAKDLLGEELFTEIYGSDK